MFVFSLSVRGLECSFHRLILFYMFRQTILCAIQGAKLVLFFYMTKILTRNFSFFVHKNSSVTPCAFRAGFLFALNCL